MRKTMGITPSKDMAICFVFFNPAGSKRLLMNYLYVANLYRTQGLPVYTIELVFGDAQPEIKKAIHVRGNSYMFHKERLYRILEKHIPRKYTKLACLDADVVFGDPEWYSDTSKLLNTHDVVQPFSRANWLDLSYSKIELTRESVVLTPGPVWDFKYHPGFAWCFRRDWYRKVGFFDWAVSGSGDTLSSAKWLNKRFPPKFNSLPNALKRAYAVYTHESAPRITYRDGDVYHLYHGTRKNRQYADRHKMLNVTSNIGDMITLNADGVYEWKDSHWNEVFLEYFVTRDDDDASGDTIAAVKQTS